MNSNLFGDIGGPKIDPRGFKSIKCSKCGGILFKTCSVLKDVTGTMVGTGSESVTIPLSVFVCEKCGHILDSDIKLYKLEEDLGIKTDDNVKINKTTNLII